MNKLFPSLFYNALSLTGAVLALLSFSLILFIILLETFTGRQPPYVGVIAFIMLPTFLIVGLLLIVAGAIRERRRSAAHPGEVRRLPQIDLNDPSQRRVLTLFGMGTVVLLIFTAFGSYKAYEYTDSDQFCGEFCHIVMSPEYTAYTSSPHARVGCVQCHIGPGADWFVRSKSTGTYQVLATLLDRYPRPISTPIKDLRPAQETCERCHWPQHFAGQKLRDYVYFLSDESNIRWTLTLLMKIGGGGDAPASGIHWHMNVLNDVIYVGGDQRRLTIPLVAVSQPDGKMRIYRSQDSKIGDGALRSNQARRMDCIDCHNRPSHVFHNPSRALNSLMALGRVDPTIPQIKSVSVKALEAPYPNAQEASYGIRRAVEDYYLKNYPSIMTEKRSSLEHSIRELQRTYARNYFPSMRVSWRSFPDNIGHLNWPGCFRCHDGKHVNDDGKVLSKDCNLCHVILAQQFEREQLRLNLSGIDYRHPGEIGAAWQNINCSECHGAR